MVVVGATFYFSLAVAAVLLTFGPPQGPPERQVTIKQLRKRMQQKLSSFFQRNTLPPAWQYVLRMLKKLEKLGHVRKRPRKVFS